MSSVTYLPCAAAESQADELELGAWGIYLHNRRKYWGLASPCEPASPIRKLRLVSEVPDIAEILLVIESTHSLTSELKAAVDKIPDREVRVLRARSAQEALAHLDYPRVDLVICSPEVEGLDGYDIVPQLRRQLPRIAVAFAAPGDAGKLAAQASQRGIREILPRPVNASTLNLLLQRTTHHERERRNHGLLRRELRRSFGQRPIVAASEKMISVLETVERAAGSATPALIFGEAGTGKEAIARAIHSQSPRNASPFVALPCTGVDPSYLESELFGRARGQFTDAAPARRGLLAEVRGGTLFLDEVGGLPPALQTRLAASLQKGAIALSKADLRVEADVHIIASTERDLEREAKAGRFSSELISLFELPGISVPPLRERKEDIPLLADHLLRLMSLRHCKPVRSLSDNALDLVVHYDWPGNVRELENALERAVLLAAGENLERQDLPDALHLRNTDDAWALRPARRAAETAAIRRALRSTGGNRTHAAKRLCISQRALLYKLKEYEIRD